MAPFETTAKRVCNKTTHIATSLIMTKHYCSYSSLTLVKQSQDTIISPIFQEMKASHRFLCHEPHLQSTVVEAEKKYNVSPATKSSSRFGDACHAKPSAFYGLSIRNYRHLSTHWTSWNLVMSRSSFDTLN